MTPRTSVCLSVHSSKVGLISSALPSYASQKPLCQDAKWNILNRLTQYENIQEEHKRVLKGYFLSE